MQETYKGTVFCYRLHAKHDKLVFMGMHEGQLVPLCPSHSFSKADFWENKQSELII